MAISATFRYKSRAKLEMSDGLLDQITTLAAFRHTKGEAAAILGVSKTTLNAFLNANPEAQDAWTDGGKIGNASLRRLLWVHAKSDPSTARFLSKNHLGLSDDGNADEPAQGAPKGISPDEAKQRVLELIGKVTTSANSSKDRGYGFQRSLPAKKG